MSSCNGMIRALDKKTGKVKWDYDIRKDGDQRQFHGDPLLTNDLVIIGTDGNMGHVYAFERSTGSVRWKYKVNEQGVASDIVRIGENLYFVTLGNELVCLDLNRGTQKWSFHTGYSGHDTCLTCSSPAAAEGRVYFGGLDGFAYALKAESGQLIWKRDSGSGVTTSAAIYNHDLYLGTGNRHLYRLNVDSGEVLGEYATESAPNRQLLIAENPLVVFLGDEVYASFDLDLKKIRWCAQASKEWTSARPYLWHGAALAGDRRELVRLERRPRMGASFSGNSPRHWNVRRDSVRGDPEGTRFRLRAQALSARQETETPSATSFDSAQTV